MIDKGIVGWEASGRNGGGCTHFQSPLFAEEQRLWPQMDELLGYPTEYRRERIVIALDEQQLARAQRRRRRRRASASPVDELDPQQVRELVPLAGEMRGRRLSAFRRPRQPAAHRAGLCLGRCRTIGGRIMQHTAVTGIEERGGRVAASRPPPGASAATSW